MSQSALLHLPEKAAFSLESDYIPSLLHKGDGYGYLTNASVIDIGTPERYQSAQLIFKENNFHIEYS